MMSGKVDRRKTLTELEGHDWAQVDFDSHLVRSCQELLHKPLEQFTAEDLRLLIGQEIGLEYLVPVAIERLTHDPLAEGDFYPGDLLKNLLQVPKSFWSQHHDLYLTTLEIARKAQSLPH